MRATGGALLPRRVVKSLEIAIEKRGEAGLLAQWSKWQSKVDPSSPMWTGKTHLPASMVLEGYLVLEDFKPVKDYFEMLHEPSTMQPRTSAE